MARDDYLAESPARGTWKDRDGRYACCDEPGPYGARCTLDPAHSWAHYDAQADRPWVDGWTDYAPDDDEDDER